MEIKSKTITFDIFLNLNKEKKVIKSLQFYILSQEAKLKSVWGPILTPLIGKEKITEFCNQFNKESSILYDTDVFVPVFFLLYDNKTYNFIIRTPSLFSIIRYIYDLDKVFKVVENNKKIYYITFEELYFIVFIKFSLFLYKDEIVCLKNMLNILIKFNVKIIV